MASLSAPSTVPNEKMASLSAPSIVPRRPWRMTRIQIRISHVHPTASIHRRSTILRLCYCGVLRAGAPPAMLWRTRVPVTRSESTVERWMGAARTTRSSRRSGPAEDRAQAGGGPEQEDGGADPGTSIRNAGGAFTTRMTAENTRRASGHCMCTLHMHMGRYDHPEVVWTLFRSIRFQRCR
jgi:hypothetical protein